MAYMQVKDILAHAERLRKFVSTYNWRHQLKSKDDFLAGLFQQSSEHEQQLQQVLSAYVNHDNGQEPESNVEGVLETWLQFPGVAALEQAMTRLADVDEQEDEIVIEHLLAAEQSLAEMYEQAQAQTNAAKVQELFGQLQQLQDTHLRMLAACASEFEQERGS